MATTHAQDSLGPLSADDYERHQSWDLEARKGVARYLLEGAGGGPPRALFLGSATGVNDALPFARVEEGMVLAPDDADVEVACARGVAPQRVLGDRGADALPVVGVDEHTRLHGVLRSNPVAGPTTPPAP